MAIVNLHTSADLFNMQIFYGYVTHYDSTRILIDDGIRRAEYSGSFQYSYFGEVFGTLHAYRGWELGRLQVEVAAIRANANVVYHAVQSGDFLGAAAAVLHGNDTIYGSSGNDRLSGFAGHDSIYGRQGNDALWGGSGNDRLFGGFGADYLNGQSGHDLLSGEAGHDVLVGETGHDRLYGGVGHDQLYGGWGNDRLIGGWGNDLLNGGQNDDLLDGGPGQDILYGGPGNDILIGGPGGDWLHGGLGADIFRFLVTDDSRPFAGQRDTILDFHKGIDIIDLRGVDADESTPADDVFAFVGEQAFSGVAGELRFVAGTGLLFGDVDGDGQSEFALHVAGGVNLSAGDFLL